MATPYPGTRLWYYALENKLIQTFNWRKYTTLDPVMELKYFSPEEISKMLGLAYISFYLRPKLLIKDLILEKGFIFKRAIPQALRFLRS